MATSRRKKLIGPRLKGYDRKYKPPKWRTENVDNDDADDDDIPLSRLSQYGQQTQGCNDVVSEVSDSEDDIPLANIKASSTVTVPQAHVQVPSWKDVSLECSRPFLDEDLLTPTLSQSQNVVPQVHVEPSASSTAADLHFQDSKQLDSGSEEDLGLPLSQLSCLLGSEELRGELVVTSAACDSTWHNDVLDTSTVTTESIPDVGERTTELDQPTMLQCSAATDCCDTPHICFGKSSRTLQALKSCLKNHLPDNWVVTGDDSGLCCMRIVQVNREPKFKMTLSVSANFSILVNVHGMELPRGHQLFGGELINIDSVSQVLGVITSIESLHVCTGNSEKEYLDLFHGSGMKAGVGAYIEGPMGEEYCSTIRANQCSLLIEKENRRCKECCKYRNTLRALVSRKRKSCDDPTSPSSHTPLSHLDQNQLKKRLEARTQQVHIQQVQINRLRKRLSVDHIDTHGVTMDDELGAYFMEAICEQDKASPFEKDSFAALFWEEQRKAFEAKDGRAVRWHPMIVRWALSIRMKSSSAYEQLRSCGFIKLPSQRTLQDYTNVFTVKSGFQPEVMKVIIREMEELKLNSVQRYCALLQDEVKIKSNLVFNKNSGELVGFVDLGNVGNEMSDFEKRLKGDRNDDVELAKYMLVLMVRSLTCNFKFAVAHFPCNGITADFLLPIIWECVEKLELIGLKMLCITCDGASPNRRFFKLHDVNQDHVIYKTTNIWAEEGRPLFFISDAPHLIKTARNCLANSFSHRRSRNMWRNGFDLSWIHIMQLYEREYQAALRLAPKLSRAHVYLSSFATMKVRLATQVLGATVANALALTGGPSVHETVKFIRMFDKFFDCLNVRSLYEHVTKRKPSLAPYETVDDPRFDWLRNEFLMYLKQWRDDINNRPGNFTASDRAKMFISHQTMDGIEITVNSFVEACQYLLRHGASFVLSENFNQDPLEQWFSLQRNAGGANENPTAAQFNHNTAALRLQKSCVIRSLNVNTRGQQVERQIDTTPLPKKRRT